MKKIVNEKNIVFLLMVLFLALSPVLYQTGMMKSTTLIYLGKCIAFAIVAIGLDMIWGYTGILSLGHGLYFSLGAYGMAMYLKLQATGGKITDFMQIGGFTELPVIWRPFQWLFPSLLLLVLVPGLLSCFIGYFTFKNRIKGVYFSIVSQALTWAAYSLFIALSPYTNGNVGITEIKSLFGSIKGPANEGNLFLLFYIALAILVLVYVISGWMLSTKFGRLLVAIRDGENRTYFSGYCVSRFKLFVYVFSAVLAAIAGAVFVNFNGSITPNQMTIAFSITMVIWVAVGGRGTLAGAVLGAFVINLCEYNLSSGAMVEIWQYMIGAVFVLTILFFKSGIMGAISKAAAKLSGGRKKVQAKQV